MSKHRIIDIYAVFSVALFIAIIFFIPPLKEAFLKIFCLVQISEKATVICANGLFILYIIPLLSICWLVIRVFTKLTKFASIVEPDSRRCQDIGRIYQKIKVLDG